MADALGWGMTDRPYFKLATAGGNRGGADEQVGGSGARRSLYAERDAGRWVFERPATTVQGDPRIGRPGHKDRDKGEAQFQLGAVRVTVAEAAALQSFPPGYPWQGTATRQHQQVGKQSLPSLLSMSLPWHPGFSAARPGRSTRASTSSPQQRARRPREYRRRVRRPGHHGRQPPAATWPSQDRRTASPTQTTCSRRQSETASKPIWSRR